MEKVEWARMVRVLAIAFLMGAICAGAQPSAHFDHIHLNSTDPARAVAFYTSHFDCEATQYNGKPAIRSGAVYVVFDKVAAPPPADPSGAIWHFGWGAEDMPREYRRQRALGTVFETPLTDISDLANSRGFYYAYVDGPDHALIELNTAGHHHLGHLHLFSADPVAAAAWYEKTFGLHARVQRDTRIYKGIRVAPAAFLQMDQMSIIIYPRQGAAPLAPSRGRVVDHIGFRIAGEPGAHTRFVQGPDGVAIELVPR